MRKMRVRILKHFIKAVLYGKGERIQKERLLGGKAAIQSSEGKRGRGRKGGWD